MNCLVAQYNAALHETAARYGVPCLPLHDRLVQLLPGHVPPPYEGQRGPIMRAAARHLLLRRSWGSISRRNGLALVTDHIHLNDRLGDVVADLIKCRPA